VALSKHVVIVVAASIALAEPSARAEDRGGGFEVFVEGGGLVAANAVAPQGAVPIAQVVAMARLRYRQRLAFAAGLSTCPCQQLTALGVLGHIEWLPLTSNEYSFIAFVGTRVLVVQPLTTLNPTSDVTFATGGGIVGEIGVELRTHWLGGYRLGANISALAGPIAIAVGF
jgi:hypothetical protein